MSEQRLTLDDCHALAMEILTKHNVSEEQARAVADTVTSAERDNCKSHGLFRIPGYVASSVSGKVDGHAEPSIEDIAPAVVRVDAKMGYAPLALQRGIPVLAEKAKANGIAAMAVANCHHFAALWPEVEAIAEHGLVGFAFTSSFSYVAPAGGTKPLYGTNPMAFAWPREGRPPLAFDQASSASARGEIQLHQRDGHDIPEGWAIDADGNPTTDPTAALAGALLMLLFLTAALLGGVLMTPRNDFLIELQDLLSSLQVQHILRTLVRCSVFLGLMCIWCQRRGLIERQRGISPAVTVSNQLMEGLMVGLLLKLLWVLGLNAIATGGVIP